MMSPRTDGIDGHDSKRLRLFCRVLHVSVAAEMLLPGETTTVAHRSLDNHPLVSLLMHHERTFVRFPFSPSMSHDPH